MLRLAARSIALDAGLALATHYPDRPGRITARSSREIMGQGNYDANWQPTDAR